MTKSFNLANPSKEDMDKTNVDLAASGVAYKERMNQPVIAEQVEREQPEHLREYFRERVAHYRGVSKHSLRVQQPSTCKWLRPTARSNRTSITTRYGGFFAS